MRIPILVTMICLISSTFASAQGSAIALDLGEAITINEPTDSLTGIRTFEAWIKWTGMNGYSDLITDSNCGHARWEVGHTGPGNFIGRWWNSSFVYADVSLPVPPVGQWEHIAITWDSVTLRSYVNGQLYASVPLAGSPAPRTPGNFFVLGGAQCGTLFFWDGFIDEARAWSVVRSQAEIQASMNQAISYGVGLVSVWHLDGNAQDTVGVNPGTIQGNATFVTPGAPISPVGISAPSLASIGGPIVYSLLMTPSTFYVFDISTTGTSPGININPGNVHIPLNPPYLNLELGSSLPPGIFVNFVGFANAMGAATATVNLPNAPQIIGLPISASFVTLNPLTPSGIGDVAAAVTTTIAGPPPIVNTIVPASGPQGGGTSIQILGAHFQPGATVQIGGTAATGVIVTSSAITCTTPSGAVGPASVVVTNPDTLSATVIAGFAYVPTLVVSSVAPASAAAGALVTLTGSGIQTGATVSVGGIPAAVQSSTISSLSFTNPASVPCGTTIGVLNPDGQMASIAFNPTPTISNIVNNSGPAAGGSSFVIFGSQFLAGTTVSVGGNAATITSQSATFLFCVAPPGAPGPASVVVASAGGCTASGTFTYQ